MRRGLLSTAWVLALTPLHWLLLSIAAWRAVYQLAVAPYAWEKTEHGLAKTSHRAARITRALLALERQLSKLKERGQLPIIGDAAPDWLARRRSTSHQRSNRSPSNAPRTVTQPIDSVYQVATKSGESSRPGRRTAPGRLAF